MRARTPSGAVPPKLLRLATEALIFAGLAMSADLLLGYCGLLSLGQALFFGRGAYVSGLFLKEVMPNFWLDIACVLVVAAVVSALAGYVALLSEYPSLLLRAPF